MILIAEFFIIGYINGCNNETCDSNYDFGVVETCADREKSRITFLDSNFNMINVIDINRGGIYLPTLTDDEKVFIFPSGKTGVYRWKDIIEIDCSQNYDMFNYDIQSQSLIDYKIDNNYIYSINVCGEDTSNMISYVKKYDINTNDLITMKFDDIILQSISIQNGYVIVTGIFYDEYERMKSYILFLDKDTLDVQKKVDSSWFAANISDVIWADEKYYFAIKTLIDTSRTTEISAKKTFTMDEYYKVKKSSISASSNLYRYNDRIIFIHYDTISQIGSLLTDYNLSTGETTSYNLGRNLEKTCLCNNVLLVYDNKDDKIYAYDVNNKFVLKSEYEFESTLGEDSFVQGIFDKKIK